MHSPCVPRRPQPWRGVHVSGGNGDPFGTYRLRPAVVLIGPAIALCVGMGLTEPWNEVALNLELGLPWWDGLWTEVLSALGFAVGGSAGMCWLLLYPRLVVAPDAVTVVGHVLRRRLPWSRIRHFDHVLGLVIETDSATYSVEALEGASLRHVLRGRRDGVDDLAARLNAHLAELEGAPVHRPELTVDSAPGRRGILLSALTYTVVGVLVSVVLWRLGL